MENNNYKSELNLLAIYFAGFNFSRDLTKKIEETAHVDYSLNYFEAKDLPNHHKVSIVTKINNHDGAYTLELCAEAIFQIDEMDDIVKKNTLIMKNTVAVMMPYIRSQVTLLTSQPGLVPTVLPIVDINKLVADGVNKINKQKGSEQKEPVKQSQPQDNN